MESTVQASYKDIVSQFDEFLQDSKDHKATWEIRSFVDENFYEWNHRIVFDNVSKQLTTLPIKSDTQYTIWKVRKIVRWVRNMILKNDPRWHPTSSRKQRISDEEKNVASALLQSIYKEDHIKDKLKDLLTHSLTKTLAWAFVGYDNNKKDIDIFIEDPFNIYTSPDGKLEWPVFTGKYIIRTIKKTIDDIKNNPIYKDSEFADDLEWIEWENKMAESDLKESLLRQEYTVPVDANWTAIVQELYIMQEVWKEDDKKLENNVSVEEDQLYNINKKAKVRIITKVWNIIIRDEMTNYDQFPFLAYQPERNKWQLYHTSWINPLIQLNKALDDWYSNRADWLEKFAKGMYVVQKGSKFSVIKGRNWQVIEYTGSKPTKLETWNLPQEVNIHLNETERIMEDLGGIHSESTGRLSGSALSWVAIAQLQASDNNNVSEPVDNLKTFLEEMAYRILSLWSKFYNLREQDLEDWTTARIVGSEVKSEVEDASNSKLWNDIIEIKPIKNIEVEIVPGSAFSDLQARQDLVELRTLWVAIPDSLIIDSYKLWNTQVIMDQYEQEQAEKEAQEDGMEWLESKQAELENKKLIEWANIVAQQPENHEIHLAIHGAMLGELGESAQSELLIRHMQQHEAMFAPENQMAPQQPNPQLPTNPQM